MRTVQITFLFYFNLCIYIVSIKYGQNVNECQPEKIIKITNACTEKHFNNPCELARTQQNLTNITIDIISVRISTPGSKVVDNNVDLYQSRNLEILQNQLAPVIISPYMNTYLEIAITSDN